MAAIIYDPFSVLDITKPPVELLISKLNSLNSRQLNPAEFVLGEPVPVPGDNPALTKSELKPIISSVFYNSIEIQYHRLSLPDLFYYDSNLKSNDFSTLYQILGLVNAAYGINLTVSDVYDDDIAYTTEGVTSSLGLVTIRAKPTSHLFYGEATVRVNVVSSEGANVSEDDRVYYGFKRHLVDGKTYLKIESQNVLGEVPAEFNFMGDGCSIELDSANTPICYKTPDNTFVVMSNAMKVGPVGGTLTAQRRLEFNALGQLIPAGVNNTAIVVGGYDVFAVNHGAGLIYFLSNSYATASNNFHVMTTQGVYVKSLTSMFSATGIHSFCLGYNGYVFVMTRTVSGVGYQYKIVRMTPQEEIDPAFDEVTIYTTATSARLSYADGNVYFLARTPGVDAGGITINGTPVFTDKPLYGFGKYMLRVDAYTGIPDDAFNSVKPLYGTTVGGDLSNGPSYFPPVQVVGDNLVVSALTSWNPMAYSMNWFNTYTKAGDQVVNPGTLGQNMAGLRPFASLSALLPVNSYETLAFVIAYTDNAGQSNGVTSQKRCSALLISRGGVISAEFFRSDTDNGEFIYAFMVNPDELV